MRLLLFDIDGTLLKVHEGARTAVRQAVEQVIGQSVSLDGISFSGRTDPAIFREVLGKNGLQPSGALLSEVMEAYTETARMTIQSANVSSLPGTASILSIFANRTDVFLGLVTGNVEPIAFHKLQSVGLASHFSIGGFGSDHAHRSKLPGLAIDRANKVARHSLSVENTVVIGDTRHDIACAHEVGARSVAVCTGRYSSSDLKPHNPDLLLENLKNADEIAEKLLAV